MILRCSWLIFCPTCNNNLVFPCQWIAGHDWFGLLYCRPILIMVVQTSDILLKCCHVVVNWLLIGLFSCCRLLMTRNYNFGCELLLLTLQRILYCLAVCIPIANLLNIIVKFRIHVAVFFFLFRVQMEMDLQSAKRPVKLKALMMSC